MVETARVMAKRHPGLQVVVPVASSVSKESVASSFLGSGIVPVLLDGHAAEAVGASDAAIVKSGTAVLEAGLMQRPFVVVYRVSLLSYWIGRLLLKVAHIALVNILANRRVVPELIQGQFNPERVSAELEQVWQGEGRTRILEGLAEVRTSLGSTGAAARAAEQVLDVLDRRKVTAAS
jgi:lipid-A-disaccharide synthase